MLECLGPVPRRFRGFFENLLTFATEALAAAIRHDPAPMLSVLPGAATRVVDASTQVTAYTQVFFAGAGRMDLVLEIRTGGQLSTVWIEVKVKAGEHGDQLANYQRHASDHGIHLVTLGRARLRPDIDHVSWSDVRRAALRCKGPGASFFRWERLSVA